MGYFSNRGHGYSSHLLRPHPEPLAVVEAEMALAEAEAAPPPPKPNLLLKIAEETRAVPPQYDLVKLRSDHDHLTSVYEELLPIEHKARKEVYNKRAAVQKQLRTAEIYNKHKGKYLPMSLECFKWRTDQGLPKLMIWTLNSPTASIVVSNQSGSRDGLDSAIPGGISSLYYDVVQEMVNRAQARFSGRNSYDYYYHDKLEATFDGIIPDDARVAIKKAIKAFGPKNVFLVAEAEFTFTSMSYELPKGDPLIVAWDNESSSLWFIHEFDTTPVEEAALLERVRTI